MSSTPDPIHLNFGLTEREFVELQEKIRHGDEQLFERVFLTRLGYCTNFLKSRYKADHGNAYDTVMRSLLIFRERLLAGNLIYGNLQAFLLRIVITRYQKDMGNQKIFLTDEIPEMVEMPDVELVDEESLINLARAWEKLGSVCQMLLKGFYYNKMDLKSLTLLLEDSSEANTRKRKERCIKELRKYFFAQE